MSRSTPFRGGRPFCSGARLASRALPLNSVAADTAQGLLSSLRSGTECVSCAVLSRARASAGLAPMALRVLDPLRSGHGARHAGDKHDEVEHDQVDDHEVEDLARR